MSDNEYLCDAREVKINAGALSGQAPAWPLDDWQVGALGADEKKWRARS
jgi:hypothetical protein